MKRKWQRNHYRKTFAKVKVVAITPKHKDKLKFTVKEFAKWEKQMPKVYDSLDATFGSVGSRPHFEKDDWNY